MRDAIFVVPQGLMRIASMRIFLGAFPDQIEACCWLKRSRPVDQAARFSHPPQICPANLQDSRIAGRIASHGVA
ncbi:hypothetical protein ACCS60_34655, partial [Rhizobium acaciae]|uniref:hypothetical protein n=1 Tax=Rhizobium acaciae TaxID=2989736 RepID=UPI003F94E235